MSRNGSCFDDLDHVTKMAVTPIYDKIPPKAMVGWLFWVKRPFETVFQSISGRLPEGGRKRRKDRGE